MEELIDDRVAWRFIGLASVRIHGLGIQTNGRYPSPNTLQRRFKSHFGITPRHVSAIWNLLLERNIHCRHAFIQDVHLLWTLDLLKGDDSEHRLSGRWGATEKNIRKWSTILIEELSGLKLVRALLVFEARLLILFFT